MFVYFLYIEDALLQGKLALSQELDVPSNQYQLQLILAHKRPQHQVNNINNDMYYY